jgi:DNA-binding transcriptional regulator YiaG
MLEVSTALKAERRRKVEISKEDIQAFDMAFASRLKVLRDERGLKRDWVAKQLGVHYNTLKNWELGKSHPGTRDLLALGQIYHIKPTDFLKVQ